MASEWEMAMGVDLGMGMGTYHHNASSITTAPMSSPHSGGACYSTAHHHHYYGMPPMGDTMSVDDLSTGAGAHEFFPTAATDKQGHHSGAMVGEPSPTANSSDHQTSSLLSFADEFYIPSEEVAELEWLSKFVDDSYSDMPNNSSAAHAAMAAAAAAAAAANAAGSGGGTSAGQDSCVTAAPGRGARSKRSSRATAAAWHSLVPRPPSQSSPSPSSCSLSSDFPSSNSNKPARPNGGSRGKKSPAGPGGEVGMDEGGVRRCTHCASEQTPQWRSGPLGPKTLCNACGVRFKSGRLMPEYRPAASPTFVLTEHSNSHRKVVELRRQKELILIRGTHRDAAAGSAGGPRPELMFRDYGGVC